MLSIFAARENRLSVAFLEHFRTSINAWTLVATGSGANSVITFPPQLHGAAGEWIAKANKRHNAMMLIAELRAGVTGVALVQGHLRGTRHFAAMLRRDKTAALEAFRPAPFARLDAGARVYAVWRLANESQIGAVEPVATTVAAQIGGVNAGWLVPIAGTTYEGARVELAYIHKDRVNVLTDFTAAKPATVTEQSGGLFTIASEVKAEHETWLWPGVVPSGALTLLTGQPKAGKTQITLDAAARVSAGRAWPTGEPCEAGRVAVFELEDKATSSIVPRLMAMGANIGNIVIRDAKNGPLNLAEGMESLAAQFAAIGGVKLLTLSPLLAFFGQQASDDAEVRRRLRPLLEWAAHSGAAIIGVLHPPKNAKTSLEAQFAGADTYRRAARAAWVVMPDPEDDEPNSKKKRRALMCAGINGAADDMSLYFRIRGAEVNGIQTSRIEWQSDSDEPNEVRPPRTMSAAQANPTVTEAPRAMRSRNETKATRWLREALASGPRRATELKEAATTAGIHAPALYQARRSLGVTTERSGVGREMVWSLPEDNAPADNRGQA